MTKTDPKTEKKPENWPKTEKYWKILTRSNGVLSKTPFDLVNFFSGNFFFRLLRSLQSPTLPKFVDPDAPDRLRDALSGSSGMNGSVIFATKKEADEGWKKYSLNLCPLIVQYYY